MPLISTQQLLQITDRLSAIYDLLLSLQVTVATATDLPPTGNGPFTYAVTADPPASSFDGADPDVALLTLPAMQADAAVSAAAIAKNIGEFENLQAALITHFQRMGQVFLLDGYLTANDIRVHQNYSILEAARTGNSLSAANVFRPDIITLATVDFTGGPLSAILTPGINLGTGSGTHSSSNCAAQQLRAIITPASSASTLAATLVFSLTLKDSTGTNATLNNLTFNSGAAKDSFISLGSGRYYSVQGAGITSGGTNGDRVTIQQVPERTITL
jgi:hypothetical protein